jgi:NAD(P)-dependent dehydrogenase (short-subunit alcohol dehydrogenase family)
MTTIEGYEQQFALNHLAGFLLTHELMPELLKTHGLVLMTSSGSHRGIKMNWKDIMFSNGYRPLLAYKQSKLCNMLFAFGLNERYRDRGLRAYGIDPGLVHTEIGSKNTGGLVDLFWKIRKTGGADPAVHAKIYTELCTNAENKSDLYYGIQGKKGYSREVTPENADRLFELSEKLCNVKFEVKP